MTDKPKSEKALVALDVLKAALQVTPPTAVAAGVLDAVQAHRARKEALLLAAVVNRHDQAIDDLFAALSDGHRLELITSALRAAESAHTEEKIFLLADIAGESIRPDADDAKVETGQYLIDVIANLEPVDITVLRVVASPRFGHGQLAKQALVGGLARSELTSRLPELGDALDVAVARLNAAGLIDPGEATYDGGRRYGPTPAGTWVMETLERLSKG